MTNLDSIIQDAKDAFCIYPKIDIKWVKDHETIQGRTNIKNEITLVLDPKIMENKDDTIVSRIRYVIYHEFVHAKESHTKYSFIRGVLFALSLMALGMGMIFATKGLFRVFGVVIIYSYSLFYIWYPFWCFENELRADRGALAQLLKENRLEEIKHILGALSINGDNYTSSGHPKRKKEMENMLSFLEKKGYIFEISK